MSNEKYVIFISKISKKSEKLKNPKKKRNI